MRSILGLVSLLATASLSHADPLSNGKRTKRESPTLSVESPEPKIVTTDGNLVIQSATNRNISFALDGNSDLFFGPYSLKNLLSVIQKLTAEVEALKATSKKPCEGNRCQNGACVPDSSGVSYTCVCQPGYSGKYCGEPIYCQGRHCQNGGSCVVQDGLERCFCPDDWFGLDCQYKKPAGCGFVVSDSAGVIKSPGFPHAYPASILCKWTIRSKPGKDVQLVFMSLDLGATENCTSDHVQVTDSRGIVLVKTCGLSDPATIRSASDFVEVTLRTGDMPSGAGFSIFYTLIATETCGGYITEDGSRIESSNYPLAYQNSVSCSWLVDYPAGTAVKVLFKEITIFNKVGLCDNYLVLYDGRNESGALIGKYCQTFVAADSAASNQVFVKFVSDGLGSKFSLSVEATCGGTLGSGSGAFQSPFWPLPYPHKKECIWTLKTVPGRVITLRFKEFDVERNALCVYDSVSVYNGDTTNASLIGQFCGNAAPAPVTSRGNSLTVKFVSDGLGNFHGFLAEYWSSSVGCGGSKVGQNGTIDYVFDSMPGEDVTRQCVWTVSAESLSHAIRLAFSFFNLPRTELCKNVYVQLFDGDSVSVTPLRQDVNEGRLCGASLPAVTVSSGRSLTVLLVTTLNATSTDLRFSASWKSVLKVADCNVKLVAPVGSFSSPNYPNPYGTENVCIYAIHAPSGHRISLTFDSFNLEDARFCENDYVRIHDGPSELSPGLGSFCGSNTPGTILSSGNFLYVKFVSDFIGSAPGFHATYETGITFCGGTLNQDSGFILSPLYPQPYRAASECVWVIRVQPGNVVDLVFEDFDVETMPGCDSDYLEVRDGADSGARLIGRYCGDFVRDSLVRSSNNSMYLKFKSDESLAGRGFKVKYSSGCGWLLSGRYGVITSPSYPNFYPNNRVCSWTIVGHPGHTVNLKFSEFDLQLPLTSGECKADYVTVYDGDSDKNAVLLKACGASVPSQVMKSNGSSMFIVFRSDDSVQRNGFRANYTMIGCGDDLTGLSGSFHSPNYPSHYPGDVYCVWSIKVPAGSRIQVQTSQIDIEHADTCEYDRLTFHNGGTEKDLVLGSYCGRHAGVTLLSSSNELLVVFLSDAAEVGKGFSANYTAVSGGCGGSIVAANGTIVSPDYPHNYPVLSACTWVVRSSYAGGGLKLTFLDVDLEKDPNCTHDSVEVYGLSSNMLLAKVCGSTAPGPIASAGGFRIVFTSDIGVAGRGFRAVFEAACGGVIDIPINSDGLLTSPGYPLFYPKSSCKWSLRTVPGNKVTITPLAFDVYCENCPRCDDKLTVLNGDSAASAPLGVFCGQTNPPSMTSTGNIMYLVFDANASNSHGGFQIQYSSVAASCGGNLKSSRGILVSPLYPGSPPQSANCIWTIEVAPGSVIQFDFNQFSLVNSVDCMSAYVQLFDGDTVSSKSLGKFCGVVVPSMVTSSSNRMTVVYYSNTGSSQSRGFKATYEANCRVVLTAPSGFIASPNWPGLYPLDTKCMWRILAPTRSHIKLTILDLDIEPSPFCELDSLAVFDGRSEIGSAMAYWCGSVLPESPFFSPDNFVILEFLSDQWYNGHGFRLKYEFGNFTSDCSRQLIATSTPQNFTSPDYPRFYPNSAACVWEITASRGRTVHIEFVDFVLEGPFLRQCLHDQVSVYDSGAPVDEGKKFATLCGTEGRGKSFSSTGDKLSVILTTDASDNEMGFKVVYREVCGGWLTASMGVVRSPRVVSDGTPRNCTWRIRTDPGSSIYFVISEFTLQSSPGCEKEYMLIRSGVAVDSPVLGKYCGPLATYNVSLSGFEATVEFYSDSVVNTTGFALTYSKVSFGCGGSFLLADASLSMQLKTPGYPSLYPPSTECEWNLMVPAGEIIEFVVTSIGMVGSCTSDFVELYDGPSVQSAVLTRYCGGSKGGPILTTSNNLHVLFRSGARTTPTRQVAFGLVASWKIGCGGSITAEQGEIRSPMYPSPYAANLDCAYSLAVPSLRQIHLAFENFSLQANSNCSSADFVEVVDGLPSGPLIGQYCGLDAPPAILGATNRLFVRFRTDATLASSGFVAKFSTVGTACGGDLITSSGGFETPTHPELYPLNRRCIWKISVAVGRSIKLTFSAFDLENSLNCTNDYVRIYNGQSSSDPLLGNFCGRELPGLVKSSGHQMTVEFVSNRNSIRGIGFKVAYDSNIVGCDGALVGASGYVTSPGYPLLYPHNTECVWTITVPSGTGIKLTIVDFAIVPNAQCLFDYLEIRDGGLLTSPLVTRLCGSQGIGYSYVSAGRTLFLKFRSDDTVNSRGFRASWSPSLPGCGGVFRSASGVIRSPNFPLPYGANLDCVWTIQHDIPLETKLVLTALDVLSTPSCSSDKLVIQSGQYSMSPVVATVCGDLASQSQTVFVFEGQFVRLRLLSGGSPSGSGFQAEYSANTPGCGGEINGDVGTIAYPKSGASYKDSEECEWIIRTSPQTRVFVHFNSFNLEDSVRCQNDFLEFRDGRTVDAPLLHRLCGHSFPSTVNASSTNVMYVRFKSNVGASGKGFNLTFNTGCGGNYRGMSGYATSPNYPNPYPPNQDCRWTVTVGAGYHIQLTQADIDLPPPVAGSCSDYVALRSGLSMTSPSLPRLCGSLSQFKYDSPFNNMLVQFVSDGSPNDAYKGVVAHYVAACGERIQGRKEGTISPPVGQYQENLYNNNERCVWVIEMEPDKRVTINTVAFLLEPSATCAYDYLEIRDGQDDQAPLVGRFCGRSKPPVFTSSSNFLYLLFYSDTEYAFTGFQLLFTESNTAAKCGGVLTASSGDIMSPQYPSRYPPGVDCGWRITAPEGMRVILTFKDFVLQEPVENACLDYLAVYVSPYPDDSMVIRRRCGSVLPGPVFSIGRSMYILFHTSLANEFKGFLATYSFAREECGGLIDVNSENKSVIQTPNYPSPYPNRTACSWVLKTDEASQIEVTFEDFEMPPGDGTGRCPSGFLIMYNGIVAYDTSNLQQFCGRTLPLKTFRSNNHLIRFVMDGTVSAKGFKISYKRASCNDVISSPSGLLASPNYPNLYPYRLNCRHTIRAAEGSKVTLYPLSFSLYNDCDSDYVQVYDGPSDSSTLLGKWCSQRGPPVLRSSGNQLLIAVHTGSSGSSAGFAFTFTSSQNLCGGPITGTEGAIASPNFPGVYGGAFDCEWQVTADAGSKIRWSVPEFDLEDSPSCSGRDFLEIRDGATSTSTSWGMFCGFVHPASRLSSGNQIYVRFKSDSQNNSFKGFKLVFQQV